MLAMFRCLRAVRESTAGQAYAYSLSLTLLDRSPKGLLEGPELVVAIRNRPLAWTTSPPKHRNRFWYQYCKFRIG